MPGTSSIDAADQHAIDQIGERDLAFAEDHGGGAAAQVELGMIGGVGARHDDRHAGAAARDRSSSSAASRMRSRHILLR